MLCFVIALRSEESTDKWQEVLHDFNNTIRSIFNQTNPEFQVYVGCNTIPNYGGTMNIMKMYECDLPSELPKQSLCFDKETAMMLTKRYPIRWYDIEVESKFAELGKPLSRFPFRSTIYVLGTGMNISVDDPSNVLGDRFHPIAFLRQINPFKHRIVTKKIKKEFGMI